MKTSQEVDVAVVGAGLAGLNAARILVEAGKRVIVLEASDRVGGRTLSFKTASGDILDGGGQWVGPTQTAVLALAAKLGVETFTSTTAGENLFFLGGRRYSYGKSLPKFGLLRSLDCLQAIVRLDRLAARVCTEDSGLDTKTLQDWIDASTFTDASRFLLTAVCRLNMGTDPKDISLFYVLAKLRSAGGFKALTAGGLGQRFLKGSQTLSTKMAAALGDAVKLSQPVSKIIYQQDSAQIISGNLTVTAKRVVVAMDPVACGRLSYEPPLPQSRSGLTKNWALASGTKIHCIYKTPFWRDQGLSGRAMFDRGPALAIYDNGRPGSTHGVLLIFSRFFHESEFLHWNTEQRRSALLETLVETFGPEAGAPLEYIETNWHENPWVGGCVSHPAPGVLTEYGDALREGVGPIQWASAETAVEWEAHMDGAVRAGEHAATRLITHGV